MLFDIDLKGNAKELFGKLYTKDFDCASLRKELETGKYDADAVNDAAINYIDECQMDFPNDLDWEQVPVGEIVPGLESSHITEAIELLLDFGLDPNRIYKNDRVDSQGHAEEYNIMQWLNLIHNGYQAADSLYLLLSHGGDPNLVVDRERLIVDPDFDVGFDSVNRDMCWDAVYHSKIHYWLVLTGFGAVHENGKLPVDPVKDFDPSRLRDHRNYYYGVIHSDRMKEGWDLCIFDKRTNWEVGRL